MPNALDPRQLHDSLLSGGEISGFDATQLAHARALARAPADATVSAVEALPEPLALAVLEAAVRQRAVGLTDALTGSARKAIAKAAKRALYQLRSSGVAVPEHRPAPAVPAPGPDGEKEELPAVLSAFTGSGERALLLARPVRGGGLESFQFVLSDEHGIVHLSGGELSRSAFRKQLKELRAGRPPVLEISREEARALLADASARTLAAGHPFPRGAEVALRHLDVVPREQPAEIPSPEPEDEHLAAQGHTLHQEPEIAPWLPPEPQLRELAGRIDEVLTSPLQLSEVQRMEQLRQKVRLTTESFFSPPMRALYAGRLWHMGRFFEASGRPGPAAIARATARLLRHGRGDSRFAELLFEKVLALTARTREGKGLPKPGEPLSAESLQAEPAGPPERKSPGGLILP